jgi:hypothetical protein
MPFVAANAVAAGSLVSMTSAGEVTPGFGAQVSSAITTLSYSAFVRVVNMTGTVVVVVSTNYTGHGFVTYFDTTTSSPRVSAASSLSRESSLSASHQSLCTCEAVLLLTVVRRAWRCRCRC